MVEVNFEHIRPVRKAFHPKFMIVEMGLYVSQWKLLIEYGVWEWG